MVKIESIYNHSYDEGISFEGHVSMTQQQFADEVNINKIIERYQNGQMMKNFTPGTQQALYGDFREIGSFHDAQNRIIAANDAFMQLPPSIRERFKNDPGLLIEFVQDEKNREEAIELGLIEAPATKQMEVGEQPASSPVQKASNSPVEG